MVTGVSADVVAKWASPNRRIVNVYGPTETGGACHLSATSAPMIANPRSATQIVGTRLYVVDEQLRLCPPGEPGELLDRWGRCRSWDIWASPS